MTQIALTLAQADPAGGAAAKEVIGATAGALVATSLLFALGFGHRAGRTQLLDRWSKFAGRVGHLPPWVALPSALGTASLITAALIVYATATALGARWKLSLPLAVLAPIGIHLIFSKLLRVPLPIGLLPMPW